MEVLINQIFGQSFIIFKKLRYEGHLLLKLGVAKVATSFYCRLDQLNSAHTKIAVNFAIQYFKGYSQKKRLLKV